MLRTCFCAVLTASHVKPVQCTSAQPQPCVACSRASHQLLALAAMAADP
jgi:hypothetical protein